MIADSVTLPTCASWQIVGKQAGTRVTRLGAQSFSRDISQYVNAPWGYRTWSLKCRCGAARTLRPGSPWDRYVTGSTYTLVHHEDLGEDGTLVTGHAVFWKLAK